MYQTIYFVIIKPFEKDTFEKETACILQLADAAQKLPPDIYSTWLFHVTRLSWCVRLYPVYKRSE